MESDRRSVWHQSEGKIHATRDVIRLRRLHTRSREITYQSFGLDRKKQVFRLAFFLAPPAGLEPATTCINKLVLQASQVEENCFRSKRPNFASKTAFSRQFQLRWSFPSHMIGAGLIQKKEPKTKTTRLGGFCFWLPLLGSNQRQPD